MKYKSLVGVNLNFSRLPYWSVSWSFNTTSSPNRYFNQTSNSKIIKHEICKENNPFFGEEAVLLEQNGSQYWFSISAIENQISPEYLLNKINESYSIY